MTVFTESKIELFLLDVLKPLGFSYIFVVTREMLLPKFLSGEVKVNL